MAGAPVLGANASDESFAFMSPSRPLLDRIDNSTYGENVNLGGNNSSNIEPPNPGFDASGAMAFVYNEGDPSIAPLNTGHTDPMQPYDTLESLISRPMSTLPDFHQYVVNANHQGWAVGGGPAIQGSGTWFPGMAESSSTNAIPADAERLGLARQKRSFQEIQAADLASTPARTFDTVSKTPVCEVLCPTTKAIASLWIGKHPGRKPTYHQSSCLHYVFNDSPYGLQNFFNSHVDLGTACETPISPMSARQKTPDYITMAACQRW